MKRILYIVSLCAIGLKGYSQPTIKDTCWKTYIPMLLVSCPDCDTTGLSYCNPYPVPTKRDIALLKYIEKGLPKTPPNRFFKRNYKVTHEKSIPVLDSMNFNSGFFYFEKHYEIDVESDNIKIFVDYSMIDNQLIGISYSFVLPKMIDKRAYRINRGILPSLTKYVNFPMYYTGFCDSAGRAILEHSADFITFYAKDSIEMRNIYKKKGFYQYTDYILPKNDTITQIIKALNTSDKYSFIYDLTGYSKFRNRDVRDNYHFLSVHTIYCYLYQEKAWDILKSYLFLPNIVYSLEAMELLEIAEKKNLLVLDKASKKRIVWLKKQDFRLWYQIKNGYNRTFICKPYSEIIKLYPNYLDKWIF
ncbi:MAG: hypothetical protein RI894_278 [Bacteroidota bacterium]